MIITREKLKELIAEELKQVQEVDDGVSGAKGIGSSEMSAQARDMAKQAGADAQEREVVAKLSKALMTASKKTNIRAGTIGALLKKLFAELQKHNASSEAAPEK